MLSFLLLLQIWAVRCQNVTIQTGQATSTSEQPAPTITVCVAPSATFNPLATNNIAVYFGHSIGNSKASLPDICNTTAVDIIILGFIRAFNGPNVLPTFDFAPSCETTASKMNCAVLAGQIAACQSAGKKVFISVGGSTSTTDFNSSAVAIQSAQTLWNIFGDGCGTAAPRPFGTVTVDGFDIGKQMA